MSFKDRLQSLLDEKRLRPADLSRLSGVSTGAISLWIRGKVTNPDGRNLVKASRVLRVRPEWLSTGLGAKEWGEKVRLAKYEDDNYPVSRVNINFSDGTGKFSTEPTGDNMAPIFFSQEWYEKNNYHPDELFAIKVAGPAMEPSLYDGDWVVINTADTTPKNGVAFAIHDEGDAVIRRLFKINSQWLASPDNSDKRIYREKPMTEENFIIGRVVHRQGDRI